MKGEENEVSGLNANRWRGFNRRLT